MNEKSQEGFIWGDDLSNVSQAEIGNQFEIL